MSGETKLTDIQFEILVEFGELMKRMKYFRAGYLIESAVKRETEGQSIKSIPDKELVEILKKAWT